MTSSIRKDWRTLSEAASREQDPQKLLQIVQDLNRALDQREQEQRQRQNGQAGCWPPVACAPEHPFLAA